MASIKIAHNSPAHSNPSELESSIAQALFDLETSVTDLKAALRPLQFSSAKEVITTPQLQLAREWIGIAKKTTHPVSPSAAPCSTKEGTGLLTLGLLGRTWRTD